jgi:trigger factor
MDATIEPLEGNKVKVSVSVGEEELESSVEEAFRKIAREVKIPGFRPGKAPRRVLEARIGKGYARSQALNDAIPEFYSQAVHDHDVDVIAPPEIDITAGEEDGPLSFDATVETRPVIEVAGYASIEVTIPSPVPTDEEIHEQLDRLRANHSELVEVDRPAQDGDFATIDIEGTLDGEAVAGLTTEDYSYEVGTNSVVAEIDENLRGASAGDERSFEAEHPDPDEDGTLSFTMIVKSVSEKVLPELDDEFAAEASEFDTLAELQDHLMHRATTVHKTQAQMQLRERTGEALAALVEDEIPQAMILNEMQNRAEDMEMRLQAQGMSLDIYLQVSGKDPAEFTEELRAAADQSVKVDLALRAVADAQGIEITDDDLADEWRDVAARTDLSVDEVVERFESARQIPAIRSDLRKRKALDWLLETVTVADEDGNPIDQSTLVLDDPDGDSDEADELDAETDDATADDE